MDEKNHSNGLETHSSSNSRLDLVINNVRLAHTEERCSSQLWQVVCQSGRVSSVTPMSNSKEDSNFSSHVINAAGSLLLPSLCHSHVHLDKCFILDQCEDLVSGDFKEALQVTARAKSSFVHYKQDLYERGYRLVRESLASGVTFMRVHVEVDEMVGSACLEAAISLRERFKDACEIQIAVFAQEPLFQAEVNTPGPNYTLLEAACNHPQVHVVGSAPYVEPTLKHSKENISLILALATRFNLHADFHLDYNLDPNSEPLIYEVLSQMRTSGPDERGEYWKSQSRPREGSVSTWKRPNGEVPSNLHSSRVTIGHAPRLQLFGESQWRDLFKAIGDLPVSFVALPQSDMYMMGRNEANSKGGLGAPRGTLSVPHLAREYGLKVAMGVNNVENPFTPQGGVDPLSLVAFGAAIYQCVTPQDLRTLVHAVTLTAKTATGNTDFHQGLFPTTQDPADFVLLHGTSTLQLAALNPSFERTTIKAGKVVATRFAPTWTSVDPMTAVDKNVINTHQNHKSAVSVNTQRRDWIFPPVGLVKMLMTQLKYKRTIKRTTSMPTTSNDPLPWSESVFHAGLGTINLGEHDIAYGAAQRVKPHVPSFYLPSDARRTASSKR